MRMRNRGLAAAAGFAALAVLPMALAGCAGGGGEAAADRATSISGVFEGSQTQTRAVGDTGAVDMDIKPAGSSLSGVGRLTLNSQVFTGPISGTRSGNSAVIDVAYGGYGPAEYNVTLSGTKLTGSYSHTATGGAADGGTITLAGDLGVSSPTIMGTSTGTTTDFGFPASPFSVTLVQNGDNVAVSGIYNGANFTGTGVIIGSKLTFSTVLADTTTVTFTGDVGSNRMFGSYNINATDGTLVNHGLWVVGR
ncbi:MAG TPA: hypothetical protein VKT77_23830 [Chthonomonadaceae bacterium]|nr:hypothetical protein [Chthonomonadaceae bacterium]